MTYSYYLLWNVFVFLLRSMGGGGGAGGAPGASVGGAGVPHRQPPSPRPIHATKSVRSSGTVPARKQGVGDVEGAAARAHAQNTQPRRSGV